jgi:hypothetical protein
LLQEVCRTVRVGVPDHPRAGRTVRVRAGLSAWDLRTVRAAPVARGPSEDQVRTVRYSRCATRGSAFFFGLSVHDSRTVRPYHADCPFGHHRPSAWCLAELLSPLLLELIVLPLWDRLGFVPRVGRSVVTT